MTLARRLTFLLTFSSIICGVTWAWWNYQSLRAERLQEKARMLAEAEAALSKLDLDLRRYQRARANIGAPISLPRHEKVDLSVRLSAEELARLNHILQRSYVDGGFLFPNSFSLSWSENSQLSLQLTGEKIFVR